MLCAGAAKAAMASGNAQDFLDAFPEGDLLQGMYLSVLYHSREQVAKVLEQVMAPENYPLVFNCMMGQDRTGVVAFLLLGLLDVPLRDRVADYAASRSPEMGRHVEELIASGMMKPPGIVFTPEQEQAMNERMRRNFTPQERYMEAVETALVKDFGGVRGYVLWLGISDAQINTYRAAMLDPQ